MPATKNLGQCHFCTDTATALLPERVRTSDEQAIGATMHTPVCPKHHDLYGIAAAVLLGGGR